jgi:phenylalanyl-tRNA synthetase alpha chain
VQLRRDLERRDLSDPAEGPQRHPAPDRPGRGGASLGADAGSVEQVQVLSATACQQLPASGISRLGARPGQKNLLVRVVLSDLDQTLTSEAANVLHDRIYRALHQGTEHQ